ncbi:efflux RND transporter periplasmic adaptor subunit [Geobacter sp. FeAm09]|uniref:efflux RND transporter periplasmic adaptor subunit n=1 Tax=Geobacter sp. FeAm09 TaxID=2597769 RepID=UPI0011EC63A5|nr:efflux RND transporter periplasmic adaptor subunit [Geobacter sp. FeAm09]QEM69033.1 efflux RND transporter periplasmic adaptor subunit [Geobacter sp. FeAm09]
MPLRTNAAVLIAGLSLLLPGCSGKKKPEQAPRPPAPVVVATATQRDVPVLLRAIGTMEASESVTIKTQLSGELTKVAFKEGQDVRKGDLLCQLDSRPYRAALKKAEAALARDLVIMKNARENYGRYHQLVKEGIVTQEQAEGYRTTAESAEASVAADRAEVENARAQLSYCTITAPISGRLGVLTVNQGNVVKANDSSLVTINKLTPIFATFSLPEKDLAEIKRHMAGGRVVVEAEVPNQPGVVEKGTVTFLDNGVDAATGTIKLKATFENSRKLLWPGQFVTVSITLSVRKNAVVVPSQAVQTGQQGQYVFVVKPGMMAELRPVGVGPVYQGGTVIEKGIQPGEQVVIDGQVRVIPGARVEVKQPGSAGPAKAAPNGAAAPAPATAKGAVPGA